MANLNVRFPQVILQTSIQSLFERLAKYLENSKNKSEMFDLSMVASSARRLNVINPQLYKVIVKRASDIMDSKREVK